MTRKWLVTIGLFVVGTATLFGCGNKTQNETPTTEATTEANEDSSTAATESTTEAAEPTTESTTTEAPNSEATTEANEDSTTATTEEQLVPKVTENKQGTGIFNGQIDSHSIEVEMENGQPETFFIYKEDVAEAFNNMDIGAKISFTYGPAEGQINPQILSVEEQ